MMHSDQERSHWQRTAHATKDGIIKSPAVRLSPALSTIDRREFLHRLALGGAAAVLGPVGRLAAQPHDRIGELGVILGLFQQEMQADPIGTLEAISDIGYRHVEMGGTYGLSPAEMLRILRRLNLRPVAGGGSMKGLQEDLPGAIEARLRLEQEYLICYWPWLHDGSRISKEEVYATAVEFNRIGAACRKAGIRFAFHNHDREFQPVEGVVPYDVFLRETDPELVDMEIDLFWIVKGGGDPLDYFARHPGRFPICHVKDMDRSGDFETPGQGVIDFAAIFERREEAGLRHFIVERDRASQPMRCAREAFTFLRELQF